MLIALATATVLVGAATSVGASSGGGGAPDVRHLVVIDTLSSAVR